MRVLRFLFRELVIHGILFAMIGTIVLSSLYLIATGEEEHVEGRTEISASFDEGGAGISGNQALSSEKSLWETNRYLKALKGFGLFLTGQVNTSRVGFSSGAIIRSGAAVTLPLALIALLVIILISVVCSA